MNNTFSRKIQILQLIENSNNKVGVKEIHEKLTGEGYTIDLRSVQRDVNTLAKNFEIENDGNKDQPGWYWKKDAKHIQLPVMDSSVALTFKMAELYLKDILPTSSLANLSQYFHSANDKLNTTSENGLASWNKKVAILSRSQPLLAPKIDKNILNTVYEALLKETKLKAHYQPKNGMPGEYLLNPIGIVVIEKVIYLLATIREYTDIRQLALHRFITIENTKLAMQPSENFDLHEYIKQGGFHYLKENDDTKIELCMHADDGVAHYLRETPLSEDQKITPIENSSAFTIQATVLNTLQLRWWLSHYGASIEILDPVELREEFKKIAHDMNTLYNDRPVTNKSTSS